VSTERKDSSPTTSVSSSAAQFSLLVNQVVFEDADCVSDIMKLSTQLNKYTAKLADANGVSDPVQFRLTQKVTYLPLELDHISAPASQAFVEQFFGCTAG